MSGAFTTAPQCGLRCSPPEYDLDVSSGPGGEAPKGEITFRKGNPGGGVGDDTLRGTAGDDVIVGGGAMT